MIGPAGKGVNRVLRCDDTMPVVGEKNPGRQIATVQSAGAVAGAGQQPEVRLRQVSTPRKQTHGDEEISGKRTPQL